MSASPMSAAVSRREFARLAGCDEKQVRRALASGKLVADDDGNLDPAQIATAWRRPRADSKEAPAARAAAEVETTTGVRSDVRAPKGDEVAGVPTVQSAQASRLKDAVTKKEDFAGRLKELEYLKEAGKVIDLALARDVIFSAARASRDAWLNWPTRYAPLMAAELGVDAASLSEVLTNYVHKQLTKLGEPDGEFRKR